MLASSQDVVIGYLNEIWLLIAAALVFSMQAGFLLLECGLVRAKNSINVAQKNISDFVLSSLAFAVFGFMVMYGRSMGGWFGYDAGMLLIGDLPEGSFSFFVYQMVFCGTAATIISGALAERMTVVGYYILAVLIGCIIYPVFGHWVWGGKFLQEDASILEAMGFIDIAGATVVHSVGAWIALAGILVIGPRIGKYDDQGKAQHIRGHNSIYSSLGCLILWGGWIGFSGGTYTVDDPRLAKAIANTILGGSAGGMTMMVLGRLRDKLYRPDRIICGVIAGLVAITAYPDAPSVTGVFYICSIAAVIAFYGRIFIERVMKIDDAVGVIPVHGFAGVWGTLALAFFAPLDSLSLDNRWDQFMVQLQGVGLAFAWAFGVSLISFKLIDVLLSVFTGQGLRVKPDSEKEGLNSTEHGAVLGTGMLQRAMISLLVDDSKNTKRVHVEPGDESAELGEIFNHVLDKLDGEHEQRVESHKANTKKVERALIREKEVNALQQRFVAMTSHEFRTPLSIIDGAAQRMLRRKDRLEPKDISAGLDKIRRAVQRLIDLIDSTLSASRLSEGKVEFAPKPISIAEIITSVCRRQQEISPRHRIGLELGNIPKVIQADPVLMEQVFTNLITNAIKYAPKSPNIHVMGRLEGSDLLISVVDEGLGIPKDELPKLFGRYFRARTAAGIRGTGIGLNLVREIMALHNGRVEVESTEGSGSCFTVRLPLKAAALNARPMAVVKTKLARQV